jgi:hypothetical protein
MAYLVHCKLPIKSFITLVLGDNVSENVVPHFFASKQTSQKCGLSLKLHLHVRFRSAIYLYVLTF